MDERTRELEATNAALAAEVEKRKEIGATLREQSEKLRRSEEQLRLALDAGRVLNIKVSRMGGLTIARQAHDLAADAGVPVWCGGMHEFGVGRAANVALSAMPNFVLPSDVSGSDKYFARDVIVPAVIANAGRVAVPTAPGIGHEVDEDWVRRNTSRTFDSAAA